MKMQSWIGFSLSYGFISCMLLAALSAPTQAAVAQETTISLTQEEKQFIQSHPVIIVGGEEDWPPFDFVENGEYTGAIKDYLLVLEKHTGLHFDVRTGYTWNELLSGFKKKQFDLLPAIYWNKQRSQYTHFTEPYLNIREYIFVDKARQDITRLEDLNGQTIAVVSGYAQIKMLEEYYPDIRILKVETPLDAIDAVLTKQADALIENTALLSYTTKQNNIEGLKPVSASQLGINNIHMGVRNDWPILRDILQKGLNKISLEERMQISQKWIAYGTAGTENAANPEKLHLTPKELKYLQDKTIIKACIDSAWMPLEGWQNNQYVGMGADYLALFQKQISTSIKILPLKTSVEAIDQIKSGQCDMFMMGLDSKQLQEYVDVTTPYIHQSLAVATRPDEHFITDITELSNKTIGIVAGLGAIEKIKTLNSEANFISVPSRGAGLQMVVDKELFGFVDTVDSIDYAIINDYYSELKIGGKFNAEWSLGVATRKDEPILGAIFTKVVQQLSEQTKQTIRLRWMRSNKQGFDYKLFLKMLVVFSVIALVFFIRHRQLVLHREEIANKNRELEAINTDLKKQKIEVQHLADHDFLTNLSNRKSFLGYLNHAISIAKRQESQLAVIFLDLDRFKTINDSLGHQIGDELLFNLATRLKGTLRESDTIARYGGDEFLILLEAIEHISYPSIVAEKILEAVGQPMEIGDYVLNVSASIGITLYPRDGETANTLITNADSAMYLAKEKGKDCYQYYTKHLSEKLQRQLQVEQALKDAVLKQQLSLLFQPQIDLTNERIVGVEALLRWQHPELGHISPVEFIPIAEDAGLINEIGIWVLRNACHEYSKWVAMGYQLGKFSINVSSVQFNQENLPEILNNIVNEYGLSAKQVELEITERYIMEDSEGKLNMLEKLRDLGFQLSVDDFGTGYSSMSYLKRLPLDIIKIDKSFISDIPQDNNNVQITKAILALSHSLGYTVVAEGVETEEQAIMLREMSCDFAQGYYFSRPVSSEAFQALLSDQATLTESI